MAERNRPHIISARRAEVSEYTSYHSGRGSPRPPSPIREQHGAELIAAVLAAREAGLAGREARKEAYGAGLTTEGLYLTFDSWPGFELDLQSFEPQTGRYRPELVSVQQVVADDVVTQRATVFVPDDSLQLLLDRFSAYRTEDTPAGNPKFASFSERIARLRLATIEALWTDPPERFPPLNAEVWWEIWGSPDPGVGGVGPREPALVGASGG